MIKTLYLVRHGHFQVPHPRPEAYMTKKSSLSVTGIEDIVSLGHKIKKKESFIGRIFTSPYLRAIETAELLGKIFQGSAIELSDNISEDKLILPNESHLENSYLKFRECADKALDEDTPCIIVSHEFPISVFVSKSAGVSFKKMLEEKKHLELVKMGECVVCKFNGKKLISYVLLK